MRIVALVLSAAALCACATTEEVAAPSGPQTPQSIWDAGQKAYRDWNRTQFGWMETDSGIQARRVSGRGVGPRPEETDTVTIHYVGKLINGTEFDSSRRRNQPATFPLPQLIRGWQEVVPMMRRGETWEFVIPAELAYGSRARDAIPANSTLIFEIELIDFRR